MPSIAFRPEPLARPSRLREYTLQYHHQPTREMIRKWMDDNPPGLGTGWEPYPLSLRTVNWIKWLLEGNKPPEGMLASLCAQASHLAGNIERHLLANHIFANAKALVFCGSFFDEPAWLNEGLQILEREVQEQILRDGGHFERSPLYHCLILEDLLDLTNLATVYPGLLPDWREPATRMIAWLRRMCHPDGEIALFNDATFGVAPTLGQLLDYAKRLGIEKAAATSLGDSGYIRLENSTTVVLFDAGPIGPDYQPGHAHCDTLSFELSHRGRRRLVNSGVSTYERGSEREQQRGTTAHNTVRVDGQEQSEIWAAFRVARRAYPVDVRTDHQTWAEAAHDGYLRLRPAVTHRRRLELYSDRLVIKDSLEGSGYHRAEFFFHQHPDTSVKIELDPKLQREERTTSYHPGFDRSVAKTTIIGSWSGEIPAAFVSTVSLG